MNPKPIDSPRPSGQQGFVLVAVLALLVVLSLLAASVALASQRAVDEARQEREAFQGELDMLSTRDTVLFLAASQRITLEGAVRQPGIYPLTGKTTLLQSIAIAQGLDPLADLGAVVLFRQIDGRKMAAVYDIRDLRKGKVEDPLLYGEDIVVVEQSGSKTALRRFIESVPAIGLFMAPF